MAKEADIEKIFEEISACCQEYPAGYVRLVGTEVTKKVEEISFLVQHPQVAWATLAPSRVLKVTKQINMVVKKGLQIRLEVANVEEEGKLRQEVEEMVKKIAEEKMKEMMKKMEEKEWRSPRRSPTPVASPRGQGAKRAKVDPLGAGRKAQPKAAQGLQYAASPSLLSDMCMHETCNTHEAHSTHEAHRAYKAHEHMGCLPQPSENFLVSGGHAKEMAPDEKKWGAHETANPLRGAKQAYPLPGAAQAYRHSKKENTGMQACTPSAWSDPGGMPRGGPGAGVVKAPEVRPNPPTHSRSHRLGRVCGGEGEAGMRDLRDGLREVHEEKGFVQRVWQAAGQMQQHLARFGKLTGLQQQVGAVQRPVGQVQQPGGQTHQLRRQGEKGAGQLRGGASKPERQPENRREQPERQAVRDQNLVVEWQSEAARHQKTGCRTATSGCECPETGSRAPEPDRQAARAGCRRWSESGCQAPKSNCEAPDSDR